MKILLLDIETAPNTAHIWGLYDQTIGINQLLESSYVLCWAAKWLGHEEVVWRRSYGKNGRYRKDMLRAVHRMLDQADAIVHYNGLRFDIPTLNKEFLLHNMVRPSPSKEIDLLKVARGQFKFVSNKLDYVVRALNLGEKVKHRGHELWLGCMQNDPKCWEEMEAYNKHDVVILEKLYHRLLPWIKNHANHSVFTGSERCPNCASEKYQRRGVVILQAGRYPRFQCQSCGSWYRGSKMIKGTGERRIGI